MSNIFLENVDHYVNAGLPVIPLVRNDKRPVPTDWTRYCSSMPDEAQLNHWRAGYPGSNIGMPLGTASQMCMIDIDTEDEGLIKAIVDVLPKSPWVRIGQKGMVMAYRFTGIRSFQVRNASGQTIVELLSSGRQVVLPPSIHPKTKLPYTANSNLWEVHGELPMLNSEIEALLRGVIEDYGIELSSSGHSKMTDWVSSGSRDVSMIEHAGRLAYNVRQGEVKLKDAMSHLRSWAEMHVEQIAGDPLDVDKGVAKIVEYLRRDVIDNGKMLPQGWDEGLTDQEKAEMGVNFGEENTEWDVEMMLDYLQEQFMKHPKTDARGRNDAVDFILQRIAATPQINELDVDVVFRYIKDTSGLGHTLATMKKRVAHHSRSEVIEGESHYQIAEDLLNTISEVSELRYHNSDFFRWSGSHWEKVPLSELQRQVAEKYGNLPAAKRNSDHVGIVKTLASLVTKPLKDLPDFEGVNFANGVLSKSGELVSHKKEYGFTYTLPYRYLPDEARNADLFMKFLHDSWSHDPDFAEKVDALQEAICATLFGQAPQYQRAILLYGAAKCGKSVLLDVVKDLLPSEGRCSIGPEDWDDKFLPAQMANKVINVVGELSETKKIPGKLFKDIVVAGEITAQHKGRDPFTYNVQCAHWFASNHLPTSRDTSAGFNRRWLILWFNKPVATENMDRQLALRIMTEEREAVVAWAVQALGRLQEQKEYTLPASHVELIEDVAMQNNSVRFFIRESGKVQVEPGNPSSRTSAKSVYSAYSFFCRTAEGVRPVTQVTFRGMMRDLAKELGFGSETVVKPPKGKERYFTGLTLVGETEE